MTLGIDALTIGAPEFGEEARAGEEALPGVGPMWDLALDSVHTFAVGNVQAVVHNCPNGAEAGGSGSMPATTTSKDLYRGGNASSPRIDNVRIGKDVTPDEAGAIQPIGPDGMPQGMSTFGSPPEGAKNWWRLPAGTELPNGLQVLNDHDEHWLIQPSDGMSEDNFRSLLQSISGWVKL